VSLLLLLLLLLLRPLVYHFHLRTIRRQAVARHY
jgi:hypothetical protein